MWNKNFHVVAMETIVFECCPTTTSWRSGHFLPRKKINSSSLIIRQGWEIIAKSVFCFIAAMVNRFLKRSPRKALWNLQNLEMLSLNNIMNIGYLNAANFENLKAASIAKEISSLTYRMYSFSLILRRYIKELFKKQIRYVFSLVLHFLFQIL